MRIMWEIVMMNQASQGAETRAGGDHILSDTLWPRKLRAAVWLHSLCGLWTSPQGCTEQSTCACGSGPSDGRLNIEILTRLPLPVPQGHKPARERSPSRPSVAGARSWAFWEMPLVLITVNTEQPGRGRVLTFYRGES